MKAALAIIAFLVAAGSAFAATDMYDGFPYTVGEGLKDKTNAAAQQWHSAGLNGTSITQDITIYDDNLSITGLAPSIGKCVLLQGLANANAASERITINAPTGGYTSGSVYYSLVLKVLALKEGTDTNIAANGGFIAGFNNTVGEQTTSPGVVGCRLHVRPNGGDTSSTQFNVGIRSNSGVAAIAWDGTARDVGATSTPVFIVARYTFVGVAADGLDLHEMWVNPDSSTFGVTEASVPVAPLSSSGGDMSGAPASVQSFLLRQVDVGPHATLVDEVRVGLTWADVTPLPPPACNDPRFDADGDHDVDLDDFGAFQRCWALLATTAGCQCFDKNGNGTIDGPDYVSFTNCAAVGGSGSGVPANPACDDN